MTEPINAETSERVVLGSAMYDVGAAEHVIRECPPSSYFLPAHVDIAVAVRDCWENRGATDLQLVAQELLAHGHLERAGGEGYLLGLREAADAAAMRGGDLYLEPHIAAVKEAAALRRLGDEACIIQRAVESGDAVAARAALDRAVAQAAVPGASAGTIPTVRADLAPDEPEEDVPWLVEGLWTAGGAGFIAGAPKSFKTMAVLDMACAIATGGDFLGRRVCRSGPVVVYAAEDRPGAVLRRIRRFSAGRGLSSPAPVHLLRPEAGLLLDEPATVDRLVRTVRDLGAVLLTLDPFLSLTTEDENAPAVARPLYRLRDALRPTGCALAVVHHMRKSSGEPGDRLATRLRGSSALFGWTDCLWSVSGKEGFQRLDANARLVEVELREAEAPEAFLFRLVEPIGPDGRPALRLEPLTVEDRATAVEHKVLDALRDGAVNVTGLRQRVGGNKDVLEAARRRLLENGKIRERKDGNRVLLELVEERGQAGWPGSATMATTHESETWPMAVACRATASDAVREPAGRGQNLGHDLPVQVTLDG
jgi:DNA-binding transcriptional ArsR family regulator